METIQFKVVSVSLDDLGKLEEILNAANISNEMTYLTSFQADEKVHFVYQFSLENYMKNMQSWGKNLEEMLGNLNLDPSVLDRTS